MGTNPGGDEDDDDNNDDDDDDDGGGGGGGGEYQKPRSHKVYGFLIVCHVLSQQKSLLTGLWKCAILNEHNVKRSTNSTGSKRRWEHWPLTRRHSLRMWTVTVNLCMHILWTGSSHQFPTYWDNNWEPFTFLFLLNIWHRLHKIPKVCAHNVWENNSGCFGQYLKQAVSALAN